MLCLHSSNDKSNTSRDREETVYTRCVLNESLQTPQYGILSVAATDVMDWQINVIIKQFQFVH